MLENFQKLWIWEDTIKALEKKWFQEPTPVQQAVIPILLQQDKNLIAQAETGTWKTAAFGIPLAEKITRHSEITKAIILAPTRELATQISDEIKSFLHKDEINIVTVYWWQSYEQQLRALKKWADIIVWTPWRVIDHLNRHRINLDHIQYLILDEADEMLNMWFIDDIKQILDHTNNNKNMLLFSATMPKEILNVAKKYMWDYETITIKSTQRTTTNTEQLYFNVLYKDKLEALCRVIDIEPDFFWIVFCKTKLDVDEITAKLISKWYNAEWIHWDVIQNQRERIIQKFKAKKTKILVATDVAARWIDVNNITHVINYCLPENPEIYIHRVGRTWRAGKKWVAITFVSPWDAKRLPYFKKATNTDIKLQEIPKIDAVIESKRNNIIKTVKWAIENNSFKKWIWLADEILITNNEDAETIIAALLELRFENELCKTKYREIELVKEKKFKNRQSGWGRQSKWDKRWNRQWDRKENRKENWKWNWNRRFFHKRNKK